ncbi:MAG TPA: DUF599 domain-containing protein [Leucothrix sp.]|nr:DUF599 domain-containing protein [Leucothrix sp.]HIQ14301.1 DUF599 domain-containing protein [Leucothrix sp.]
MPSDITISDIIALFGFFLAWYSVSWIGRHYKENDKTTLSSISKSYRNQWMLHLLERSNRMPDVSLIGNLMRSVSFFASTSILILASLIAIFGVVDDVVKIIYDIPYAQHVSPSFTKIKLLLLVVIFVYSFFKLVWSLRQYNSTVIMIGAAPDIFDEDEALFTYANNLGIVLNRATRHFVEGMRAFEYALAALAWFIHPLIFMFTTILVSLVIYRREFASKTLKAMIDD